MTGKVLLVDDASEVREALGQTLELGGYQPILAGSFVAAKDYLNAEFEGVIVSDIRMPGKDGFELLAFSQAKDKDLPVILLTGEGDVPMAVRGMTLGAFDFLEKPCEPKHLLGVVAKAMAHRMLVVENRKLKAQLAEAQQEKVGFLGRSKAAAQIREVIRLAGRVSTPVLICGASGTGRGHVARLINGLRSREGALRQIDCLGPIDWTQIASALRQGAVAFAEIEHLSPADQSQLARLLGENSQDSVYATASDTLEAQMQAGNFSEALFYALAVVRIDVPPLSDRPEDVAILFDKFLREEIEAGAYVTSLDGQAAARGLDSLDRAGNLRTIRNHAKKVAWGLDPETDNSLKAQLERVERSILQESLQRHKGNASDSARALGLPRKTFYDRLARLSLRPEDYR